MNNRIVSTEFNREDTLDVSLRPSRLGEYVGQQKIKEALQIFISAAKVRDESLDHVLLYGPPGLGKTTLAIIIANEMNAPIRLSSGPSIESPADLAAILTNLTRGEVLFIDEIHRLSRPCEEILYSAMEDFALDMVIGKGPSARTMRLKLEPFTLIGATTKAGRLSAPLRDRFGIVSRLESYSENDLAKIIKRNAKILDISIEQGALTSLAKRSRGTPRVANRLLKRVRDFAQSGGAKNIEVVHDHVARTFELLQIDELGLDATDINIIQTMISKFGGGPVGLETLAASTSEDSVTIEDVVEPYLLQLGYIAKTPRGRIVTEAGYAHFGITAPLNLKQLSINEKMNSDDTDASEDD